MDAEDIDEEKYILFNYNCTTFKSRFQRNEYHFGSEENTTFYVYVYDFRSPIQITVLENSSLNVKKRYKFSFNNFRSRSVNIQNWSCNSFSSPFLLALYPCSWWPQFYGKSSRSTTCIAGKDVFPSKFPAIFGFELLMIMCSHVFFFIFFSFRRQRLFVEMEQMASRPFSHVLVELQVPPNFPRRAPVPNNRCTSGQYLSNFYSYFIVMCL